MSLQFWNNPLVVSAMRLKHRRGSPGLTCSGYLLALLGIGALLHYNAANFQMPFGRAYLLTILSIQCVLSGGIAMFSVAASMGAEVVNRTLDFQRIVSLSPREIIVGKMIGEPANSYFLLMTTVPLAVICWYLGAAPAAVVALLYVNLFTFTLMAASLGTIHPLVAPTQKTRRQQNAGAGWVIFLILFMTMPTVLRAGTMALNNPWLGIPLGLFTPVASLMHLYEGDALAAVIPLWGLEVPSLLAAPLAELAVVWWAVGHMTRRLNNDVIPSVTKLRAYGGLAVFDLLLAGLCYHEWLAGDAPRSLAYQFALAHLIGTMILLMFVTPQRSALLSWVWRFRGRLSWGRDFLIGDRSEITLSLMVMAILGAVVFLLAFHLPTFFGAAGLRRPATAAEIGEAFGMGAVMILALGMMYQWFVAMAGRSGAMMFVLILLAMCIVPPILAILIHERTGGEIYGSLVEMCMSLSPASYFGVRIAEHDGGGLRANRISVNWAWLGGLYLPLGLVCYWGLRRWMGFHISAVATKLQRMRVNPS